LVDLTLDSKVELKEVLESYKPDIIGCGGYTVQVNPAREIMAEAKKILPNILTVVGGQHATVMPRIFSKTAIDVVVVGEGVFPLKKYAITTKNKKALPILKIYITGKRRAKEKKERWYLPIEKSTPAGQSPFPTDR